MTEISVRPYSQTDRFALHRIAADTAFFGEPVEAFLDDRSLFCDAVYAYYTDLEPEHSWVACTDRQVSGFIVGSIDTEIQQRRWRRVILPGVLWRALCGRYCLGRTTWHYTRRLMQSRLRSEVARADLEVYPAHLHINVDRRWRGQGAGRRLMNAYLSRMRELGVQGVHLHTTSLNEAACRLYVKTGFRLIDAHTTQLWSPLVSRPVENRCYGLRLA